MPEALSQQRHRRIAGNLAAACLLILAARSSLFAQKNLASLQDALVSIEVKKDNGRAPNIGTGFVIAVTGHSTFILTANHLFLPDTTRGEPAFNPAPWVTFHADPNEKKGRLWPKASPTYGISIIEVVDSGLGQLPRFSVRDQALDLVEHVFILASNNGGWPTPEMSINELNYDNRPDRFTYGGTGVASGFSGSPVVDRNGLLVGIHQGETPGTRYGWAQRIKEIVEVLPVLQVKPQFGPAGAVETANLPRVLLSSSPTLTTGTLRDGKDGLKYVWIAPDKFTMGCSPNDSDCADDENPAHQVTLSKGFWMGQTPVTVAAWKRYAAAAKGVTVPTKSDGGSTVNSDDQAPVVAVTWEDARAYCGWAGGLRLPTEAQWEYAARAGSLGARYGDLEKIAMRGSLQRVKSLTPNAWNLYNMLGSVWQWTADWYGAKYYTLAAVTDPPGAAGGETRALRGGSWVGVPLFVRASYRDGLQPANRGSNVGFRCIGE